MADEPRCPPDGDSRDAAALAAALDEANARLRDLERRHDQLRRLYDLIPLMVHLKSHDGRFLIANHASHDAYGVADGELIGVRQADTFLGSVVKQYEEVDRRIIDSGEPFVTFSDPFTRADGEQRIIDWIKLPWPAREDEEAAVLVIGADSTERETTGRRALRQERFAALGEMTATVSHELRNPLAAIRPTVLILKQLLAPQANARLQELVDRIDRSALRCERIIEQLLDYTRLTSLRTQTLDPQAWLTEVLDEQELLPEIEVRVEPPGSTRQVTFDPDRMRQAIVNIIANAVDAMRSENDQTRARANSTLTIATLIEADRLEIHIEDNGCGMTPEELASAFEPLFSTKGFGTGLGLSIVRQILEQHEGGVTIRSNPARGTRVMLWVPCDPPVPPRPPGLL